jgi:LuxR family maltose regulon positive regulatory protein
MRSEILGRLPEDEQRFLLFTSLLSTVTPRFAVGLCGPEAYGLWRRIRYRYLPATLTADRALVYHPRFRDFLREQLEARYADELPALVRRQAGFLVEEELFEDAVEIYLGVGDLDQATVVAEQAIPQLTARADWPLILRWFDAIGQQRVADHPLLFAAYLRCLYATRRIAELNALVHDTHRSGELMKIVKADPGVLMAVTMSMQWHPAEALQLLQSYQIDYRADGLRYELQVTSGRDAVAAPAETSWSDAERPVSWGLMVQGRLHDLISMLPGDEEWPPIGFYRTPHPLLGLVWQGEVARARELLDQVPDAIRTGAHSDFWYFHEAWVCWAEEDLAGAVRAARAAVTHSSRTNFGWEPCFNIMVGHFLVLGGELEDASALLAEAQMRAAASLNRAYSEWALTFEGLACLRRGEAADALRRLRRAYRGMRRARRHLMLPFAGIYLSEVEFQMGNVAEAVAIADETYELTERMGALFVLRRAVENTPEVVERMIAHGDTGNRWRRLHGLRKTQPTVARQAPTLASSSGHIVEVQTFGDAPDLIVDGSPINVRRLKTIEMAAYLALHPEGVERKRLQARLFPDADQRHGGNYYRQIVHKLRLCVGASLERNESGLISWPEGLFVESADQRFEKLLNDASQLTGLERLGRMRAALEIPVGDYLQDSNLEWAEERRFELDLLRVEATTEAAQLALQLGRMDDARELAELAIKSDAYAEPAYHTLMQVEAAVGAPGAVMAVFRRLTDSLESLKLPPSADTMQLVRRLRDDS